MANALSRAALKNVSFTTPLGSDVFKLVSLRGRAALSELFAYRLEVLVERGRAVDFSALLGAEVAVLLEQKSDQGATRAQRLHGIVRRLGEIGESATHVAYQLEVVPRFWLWTQRRRCRIFQDQTTPQILEQVLDGLDVRFELSNEYRVHNYRTQFRESDYDFACRLMEEEGVYYYFREEAAGHQLVLADNSPASAELPGGPLRFSAERPQAWEAPRVRRWQKFQELRPARITLADHSFQLPEQSLEASRTETISVAAGTIRHQPGLGSQHDLEIFDYPGGYAYRFDGIDAAGQRQPGLLRQVHEQNERTVRVRVEEQAARTLVIEAAGDDVRPVPGMRCTLSGHGHADGDYLVTWVEQELELPAPWSTASDESGYGNRFGAMPLSLPFRPARQTLPPRPDGPQTATVVGPAGEEVHCDPFGRIKIHFHWDRAGRRDGSDSCWVRVASTWAGNGFGVFTLPRVGHEVVISFLDGDLDRPLVTGSVYNASHMPPMPLPEQRDYSTITSQSRNGDSTRFAAVTLRDAEKEQIFLQATNDIELDAGEQLVFSVPDQCTSLVGETHIQSVGWFFPKLGGSAWKKDGGWERTDKVLQDLVGGGRTDITRGTHGVACLGESNQYTWFSRNEVTIDPFSWSTGMTSGWWSRNMVKGKVPTAKTTAVYGGHQVLGYGPMLNVQCGQVIGLVGTYPGWQKAATLHAALVSACCVLPGLYSLTRKSAYLDANTAADTLANLCLALLVTCERDYAKGQAAKHAVEAAGRSEDRQLNIAEPALTKHANLLKAQGAKLAANSQVLQTHEVQGPYALRADSVDLFGNEGVFLSAQAGSPLVLLTDGDMVLTASNEMYLSLGAGISTIELRNDSSRIILEKNSISLRAGNATIEIGPNDVKINGATIAIAGSSQATLAAPQVTVGKQNANGTLKGASWNVES